MQTSARERRTRLGVVVATLVTAVALVVAGLAQAADQRLDNAIAALEKARALVQAAETGGVPAAQQKEFDRHRAKAVAAIEKAMAEIAAAKAVVDTP